MPFDPTNSETTAAKVDIVEFAAWLREVGLVDCQVTNAVRKLEKLLMSAYSRGVEAVRPSEEDE